MYRQWRVASVIHVYRVDLWSVNGIGHESSVIVRVVVSIPFGTASVIGIRTCCRSWFFRVVSAVSLVIVSQLVIILLLNRRVPRIVLQVLLPLDYRVHHLPPFL